MKDARDAAAPSVPAAVYDAEYFLHECEGFDDFTRGEISRRLLTGLNTISPRPGECVLDIGCGRGEATRWAAQHGAAVWGLDYASTALQIAVRAQPPTPPTGQLGFIAATALKLPFADNAFHYVLMMDIVEHLYPAELDQALREVHRVLRPDGQLLVHTAPNLWYYRAGYPVFRLAERLRGKRLPANPKDRFPSHSLVHVNEQSPVSLHRALKRAGLRAHVWVDSSRTAWERMGRLSRWAGYAATHLPLIKWLAAGDIFALAHKE